jgi:uncharacterized GH25 family protein
MSEKVRMGLIVLCLLLVGVSLRMAQSRFSTGKTDQDDSLAVQTFQTGAVEVHPVKSKPAEPETGKGSNVSEVVRGMVSGRLYDSATDAGISGQTLYASPKAIPDASRMETLTDASGRYEFVELREGNYEIWYRDIDGYSSKSSWQDTKKVAVSFERPLTGIDFPISKGITISGRVIQEDGKPVGNTRVTGTADRGDISDSQNAQKNGTFTLYGFKADSRVTVGAIGGPYFYEKVILTIGDTPLTGVELVARAPASISGVLLSASGQPFPDRKLYMMHHQQDAAVKTVYTAQKTAEFKFEFVMAGSYSIHLSQHPENDPTKDPAVGTITVSNGQHLEGVELVVTQKMERQVTIAGKVTDDHGDPIKGAQVYGFSRSDDYIAVGPAVSDEDGFFEFPATNGRGVYRLSFTAEGYLPNNKDYIDSGSRSADIVLTREARINGTVIDRITRKPVTQFELFVKNGEFVRSETGYLSFRDEEGRFSVGGVRAHRNVSLQVRAKAYADNTTPVPALTIGETVEGVVVEMEPPNVIRGQVRDNTGRAVEGVTIKLADAPDFANVRPHIPDVRTDEQGLFELNNVARGTHTLKINPEGYQSQTKTVLVDRPDAFVPITLNQGASLKVIVSYGGEPLEGIRVSGFVADLNSRVTENTGFGGKTDVEGIFTAQGLFEGTTRVTINHRSGGVHREIKKMVEVVQGNDNELIIAIEAATSTVEGYLMADENTPTSGTVTLRKAGVNIENQRIISIDLTGHFRFNSIEPGSYVLMGNKPRANGQGKYMQFQIEKDEHLEIDIIFNSGAALTCEISNVPSDMEAAVVLYSADVSVPSEFTFDDHGRLFSSAVAMAEIHNGIAKLVDIEPGSYTAVAFASMMNGQGDHEIHHFAKRTVTIHDYTDQVVPLSF